MIPPTGRTSRQRARIHGAWLLFLGSIVLAALLAALLLRSGQKSNNARTTLLVYCAASLKTPMEAIARDYETRRNARLELQFGGSQTLLANIQISRRGDLYLPADDSYLAAARDKNLIGETLPLLRMTAVLAVRKGNPRNIHSLDDLLRDNVSLAQANPDAAAIGKLLRETLQKTGQWETLKACTKVFKPNVNDVANDIKLGAVDAGFIWDAQVPQYPDLEALPIPGLEQVQANVAASLLRCTTQPSAAQQFLRYLGAKDGGLKEFETHGYKLVPEATSSPSPDAHQDMVKPSSR